MTPKPTKTYVDQVSMSLDSSDTFSTAAEGKQVIGRDHSSLSRTPELPGSTGHDTPWVYLFTHRSRVEQVNSLLSKRFETFIHRTVIYQKNNKKLSKKEQPTISGLIFVHTTAAEGRQFIADLPYGLHLANNYSTGRTAEISHKEMTMFMRMANATSRDVRFMLNPLDYYAESHQRIRITSGDLAGCEGYIVRLHRDRRLITTIGNMTVAISGITKDSFENAEEYVAGRHDNEPAPATDSNIQLSPIQEEINRSFFNPKDDIDAMAIAKALDHWHLHCRLLCSSHKYDQAIEVSQCVLEQIGSRFPARLIATRANGIADAIAAFDTIQTALLANPAVDADNKARLTVAREALALRYPALHINLDASTD